MKGCLTNEGRLVGPDRRCPRTPAYWTTSPVMAVAATVGGYHRGIHGPEPALMDTSDPRQFRPQALRHLCPSVLKHFGTGRHQDISTLKHSGPNAEIVRTIGQDTSVFGPGHFGTSAEM